MRLDVICNTHDRGSAHPQARFVDAPKVEITQRCVASLAASLRASGVEHRFRIIDDHSSDETVEWLRTLGEVVPLEGRGYLQSLQAVLRTARASPADLVYMVEDDYLHVESAVREMVDMHAQVQKMLPRAEVAIKPYDDPNDYDPRHAEEPCTILPGAGRHWKTVRNSCGTLMWTPRLMNHPLVVNVWDQIAKLYMTPTGRLLNIHEGTTINRVWSGNLALLLGPLPSLAAHVADKVPTLFDWRAIWTKYAQHPIMVREAVAIR